jgi:hypothetical protein
LGILILKESVDVRYYSFWAVETYLCFLDTLGYTKGAWRDELTQEWSNYVLGSDDDKLKEEWKEQAKQIKEEKAKIDEGKKDKIDKGKEDKAVKKGEEKARGSKYVTKMSRLMEIRDSFAEIEKKKRVSEILIWLDKDIKDLKIKKGESASEDRITELTMTLNEWEEQHKPIREAWEEAQIKKQRNKEIDEENLRKITGWKASLKKWRGKDSKGVLWTERVKPVIAKIGNCLDPKTQKKYLNNTYLRGIRSDTLALIAEVKSQEEEAKTKKAGLVEMPQVFSDVFDDLTREESAEVIEEAVESVGVGEPFKTTRTVPYYEYLLIKLDRWLKGKGKNKPREPRVTGYMGRSIDEL